MVLLLTDVFLLLTQILLWILVGFIIWYFLQNILKKEFLGLLVLLLFLAVIALSFFQGGISEPTSVLAIVWRLISFPLTPFGLGMILLTVILLGGVKTAWANRLIRAGLILLAIASVPLVSYWLAQELEMEAIEFIAPLRVLDPGARPVIVLLGQNTTRLQLMPRRDAPPVEPPKVERPITPFQFELLSQLPIQLTEAGDRIVYAAQLYREEASRGTPPLIVVSAGSRIDRIKKEGENREEITEAQDIQTMLTRIFNIPENDILLDHNNGNIHSSAEEVKKLLEARQINYGQQIILVGSALNMNRAVLTFQRVFDESCVAARPTDFFTVPTPDSLKQVASGRDLVERDVLITDVLPTVDAFWLSSKAFQEYLNALYYFLRGWIRPLTSLNPNCPIPERREPRPTPTSTDLRPPVPSPTPTNLPRPPEPQPTDSKLW
jgi:uncharacterized SAM-binding protein YcdF (DUF218 family)